MGDQGRPGCGKSSFMKTIGRGGGERRTGCRIRPVLRRPGFGGRRVSPGPAHRLRRRHGPACLRPSRRARRDCISIWGSSMTVLRCRKERRAIELCRRATARSTARRMRVLQRLRAPPARSRRRRNGRGASCGPSPAGAFFCRAPAGAVQLVSGEELRRSAWENAVLYQNPLLPDETEAAHLPDEKRYYLGPDAPLPDVSDVTALLCTGEGAA